MILLATMGIMDVVRKMKKARRSKDLEMYKGAPGLSAHTLNLSSMIGKK
ncbi:MAG: hypothetical protein AABY22_26280 [Nanoarchaeota archaeon]